MSWRFLHWLPLLCCCFCCAWGALFISVKHPHKQRLRRWFTYTYIHTYASMYVRSYVCKHAYSFSSVNCRLMLCCCSLSFAVIWGQATISPRSHALLLLLLCWWLIVVIAKCLSLARFSICRMMKLARALL